MFRRVQGPTKGNVIMQLKTRKAVYIIGCSNMGAYIAGAMSKLDFDVYIIDLDEESFRNLPLDYSGFTITGDACDTDFLESQIAKDAYLVLVSTDSDNVNSFVAQYVKKIMGIDLVITRIYDVDKHILMDNSGIKIIYPSILTANKFFDIVKDYDSLKKEGGSDR